MTETFADFIKRNPQYQPIRSEELFNVYAKQNEAFIAYTNERVEAKMAEIDEILRKRHINP